MKPWIIALITIPVLLLSAIVLQGKSSEIFTTITTNEDLYFLPSSKWIRVGTAGFNEAAADLIWIKAIVYFSEAPKKKVKAGETLSDVARKSKGKPETRINYTFNYLKTVSDLDPFFDAVYTHGAKLAMYADGQISRRSIEDAISLLDKGLDKYPGSGPILFQLGFLYYWELANFAADTDEKESMRLAGTRYLRRASLAPDAPAFTAELATSLLERHNLHDLVVEHLKNQLLTETDPGIRASLIWNLQQSAKEQYVLDLEQIQQLYGHWKKDAPWIPFDLFTLLTGSALLADSETEVHTDDADLSDAIHI